MPVAGGQRSRKAGSARYRLPNAFVAAGWVVGVAALAALAPAAVLDGNLAARASERATTYTGA
jgi:hypothetical protein